MTTENRTGSFWLTRQLMNSDRWLNGKFDEGKAWADLCGLAEYKHRVREVRGTFYEVSRGQILVSITKLAERWNWNRKTVTRFLESLKKSGDIGLKKNNRATFISLSNYDYYQPSKYSDKKTGQHNGQQKMTSNHQENAKKGQQKGQQRNLIIRKREKLTTTGPQQKNSENSSRCQIENNGKGENSLVTGFQSELDPYLDAVDILAANPRYGPGGSGNYVPPKRIGDRDQYKNKMWGEFIKRQDWGQEAVLSLVNSMKSTINKSKSVPLFKHPDTHGAKTRWVCVEDEFGKLEMMNTKDPEKDDRIEPKTEHGEVIYYRRSAMAETKDLINETAI